jgi:Zn-dependent protease with chaperone function
VLPAGAWNFNVIRSETVNAHCLPGAAPSRHPLMATTGLTQVLLADGTVVIYSGLIQRVHEASLELAKSPAFEARHGKMSVAEIEEGLLATVLSHEICHVLARHGAENISRCGDVLRRVSSVALLCMYGPLCSIMLSVPLLLVAFPSPLLKSGGTYLLKLPNSRAHETEADLMGACKRALPGWVRR